MAQSRRLDHHEEYPLTRMLFQIFSEWTGYSPAWGMLTGIHPVKLFRSHAEELGEAQAEQRFLEDYFVAPEKIALLKEISAVQHPFLTQRQGREICLYIGIPFCPTKCAYCSFVSQSIEKTKKLIQPFFEGLCLELERTAQVIAQLGLSVISVYVGGGTPTSLSAQQLEILCQRIHQLFDLSACREFTLEAGRPDTMTADKLAVLKAGGVTRISINPQSLSDRVLARIGRAHTGEDVRLAFARSKKAGFSSINSDLIVGLPEDDLSGFRRSLLGVMEMGATNITVHALALKRASAITGTGDFGSHQDAETANAMMDFADQTLRDRGFVPYYLYRQNRMTGNLENTGWCKPGDLCQYNIYTMDDSVSVIACGGGGVTKLKSPVDQRLVRLFNFKYPHEYIARHEEILQRKDGVIQFYEQFS